LLGWLSEELTDHDEKYYRKWAHEIPSSRHSKRGTIIDVHHNIVPIVSGRHIDADLFATHSTTTPQGFQVLSFPAMTLHSLIHMFFNEDVKKGYRDLIDIHILMTYHSDNDYWQTLLSVATETGFQFELFLVCRYVKKILKTDIPDFVLNELAFFSPLHLPMLDFMY
jgi:hypothetical protein